VAQLGIGIVGTGRIAQAHLKSLATHPQARAVACFDVLPERARQTAAEFAIPNVCASLEDLLERRDVDAVVVCTPPFAHAQPTITALEAGKHVLCEKPFAIAPAEAEAMVAAAERNGRFLACCSARNRVGLAARMGHEIAARGDLGKVYFARSSSFRVRGRPGIDIFRDAPWFVSRERAGGGALIDIGVYQLDWLLWMLGSPRVKTVLATTYQGIGAIPPDSPTQDVEDHAVVSFACDNGASAVMEIAWSSNIAGANALVVLGTEAGLRFDPLTKIAAGPDRQPVEEQLLDLPPTDPAIRGNVTTAFVDALLAGEEPQTPGRDALEVTRLIDAAYRSAATGQAVQLS